MTRVRPSVGNRLARELVLEAVRDLGASADGLQAGATANQVWAHLASQGHYYDVSGVDTCLRRAAASGAVIAAAIHPAGSAVAEGSTVPQQDPLPLLPPHHQLPNSQG